MKMVKQMNNSIFKHGKWICSKQFLNLEPLNVLHKEKDAGPEPPKNLQNIHTLIKKLFTVTELSEYRMRITADDYYKLYINGNFVGQGPAQGYHFCYYWNEYDITDFLHIGENEVFVDVYYNGLINRSYNSGDGRMGMVAEIASTGGVLLATDSSWKYTVSAAYGDTCRTIGYGTLFAEDIDSRWVPGEWFACCEKEVDYTFSDQPVKALQVYKISPVLTEEIDNKGRFYDFGEEITGSVHIIAVGKSGERIRVLLGEETENTPERVRNNTRCNCLCEEFWTLSDGECCFEQYDYKAFRYLAVIPEGEAEILSVEAVVRHYPFDDEYCTLKTNDPVLQQVWQICKNGVKYGAQEVFVDCPMREKGQYAGDLTVTSAAHIILTGDLSLFKKAIDNQMQSAVVCPGLLAITPGSLCAEIADYSLQFPILALRYYHYTGDREYLKKNLDICEGIINHFKQFADKNNLLHNVIDKWNLVDWPENLRDNYDFQLTKPVGEGCHNVINAFYIGCVKQTEEIREILNINKPKESEALVAEFNRVFFNHETGLYVDSIGSKHSSLHANVIPAFYGICSKESYPKIGDFIMKKGLCCGVYMSYFLLKALCRMGRYSDAYSLITSTGEHSWYNMIKEGATTCFEAWGKDQKWNTSLCHPWASAPISVLAEDILPNMPQIGELIYKCQ